MEQENKTATTRAEKKDATKKIIRELLKKQSYTSGTLIDEASAVYTTNYGGEPNEVRGRIGSVIDVMKKEGEITADRGRYALKTQTAVENKEEENLVIQAEKPKKTRAKKSTVLLVESTAETKEEKPKKSRAKKKTEDATEMQEEKQPLPPPPVQPIAPTAPVTPEIAPEPIPEKKKRGRKAKANPAQTQEEQPVEPVRETQPDIPQKAEPTQDAGESKNKQQDKSEPKGTLMDMSFLFGAVKPKKEEPKRLAPAKEQKQLLPVAESCAENAEKAKKQEKQREEQAKKEPVKSETKAVQEAQSVQTVKTEEKATPKRVETAKVPVRRTAKALTADERLQEEFLKRIRKLGGEYFEYYSVYLIEKYSRMSGRRLEGLKISGGEHDGGIDGEIELTDRMGFRETIYIQSKNWNPDKGDERLWVVGETLLQQFIGACACRQAKDGKQHTRGIFITTSRFTAEAKKILDSMSDKIVGYDGEDLYETAKECQFGIVKKNGEYVLDEALLSGEKAFFSIY